MFVVEVQARDLDPPRVDQVRRALAQLFAGRVFFRRRGDDLLAVGQLVRDDDVVPRDLREQVVQALLAAHCAPCSGSVSVYQLVGPSETFGEVAAGMGLDLGKLSCVDQLADLA